ncbi:MAG: hypothetical protein LW855_03150 [Alphaproteobacteria bacterium]|nr:hypothetical protein [Alphaproteobacteria bacterium]
MPIALKIAIAVTIILGTSWLSGKRPELAGFLTALPLVSILALAFSYTDHQSLALSSKYARSIIIAVPVSWLFFLPFFFAERLQLSFWQTWGLGLVLLAGGYFLHQTILRWLA